jgi:hypothetical protein
MMTAPALGLIAAAPAISTRRLAKWIAMRPVAVPSRNGTETIRSASAANSQKQR